MMQLLFERFSTLIIFLHLIGAVFWVGGMIILRFIIHPHLRLLSNEQERFGFVLALTKSFFGITRFFIALIVITGIIMVVALHFKTTDLYWAVHVKEAIWTFMTLNFGYIYFLRNQAQKLYENNALQDAQKLFLKISKWLIPVNIILGSLALVFGVILQGF